MGDRLFLRQKSPEQKIIGIRTDFRPAGESEGGVVNAMIEGACDLVVRSREELTEAVLQFIEKSPLQSFGERR